jgi:hypothetical protein
MFVVLWTMRRLLISIAGGLILPLGFYTLIESVGGYLEFEMNMESTARVLAYAFLWPLLLWSWVFPPPPSCPSCGPTDAALVAAVITYFIFYSALTYLVQFLFANLWARVRARKKARLLYESRAVQNDEGDA